MKDHGYTLLHMPDHPLSRRDGKLRENRLVLFEKLERIGPHECHWGCGRLCFWSLPVTFLSADRSGLMADHLDGEKTNNDPSNVVPSCGSCNSKRARRGNPLEFSGVR